MQEQPRQVLHEPVQERRVYSVNSRVWELYRRIDKDTRTKLAAGSFILCKDDIHLNDVVLQTEEGLVLTGSSTAHGEIYQWLPGKNWIQAEFRPKSEEEITPEQKEQCVRALINYYGEPTHRNGNVLDYHMGVGKRTIRNVYENGEVDEQQVPIDRYLRIQLDPFIRIVTQQEQPEVVAKPSLLKRFIGVG